MTTQDLSVQLKPEEASIGPHVEELLEKNSSDDCKEIAEEPSIDPENEIIGLKLLVLHIGLCLCTFLTGLVSQRAVWFL